MASTPQTATPLADAFMAEVRHQCRARSDGGSLAMAFRLLFATEEMPQPIGGGQPASALVGGQPGQPLALDHVEHGRGRDGAHGGGELPLEADGLAHHPAESCHLLAVGRYTAICSVHGRVRIDEYSTPMGCPLAAEGKW